MKTDWESVVTMIGLFTLIILFWGEPDLIDAVIYHLMEGKA